MGNQNILRIQNLMLNIVLQIKKSICWKKEISIANFKVSFHVKKGISINFYRFW